VKPARSKISRKDSGVGGGYEEMFNGELPIRGITPSMIEEPTSAKKGIKSVMSYAMGQRMRAFEH
jgi:hypothetical protein